MNEFLTNLRRQAEENPMLAIGAGTAVTSVVTQFLNAAAKHRNSKAWKQEVKRRSTKSK